MYEFHTSCSLLGVGGETLSWAEARYVRVGCWASEKKAFSQRKAVQAMRVVGAVMQRMTGVSVRM